MPSPELWPSEDSLIRLQEAAVRLTAVRPGAVIALDGMACSGKTTLAAQAAARIPGCFVVHLDDFFLPPEKRAEGYAQRVLANADIDRFLSEVLLPLSASGDVWYRPYQFHPTPRYLSPVCLPANRRLIIVEGAYSLHPALWEAYDFRILMTVSSETQRARILRRNGEALLSRFLSEWIPLENRHIHERHLAERCDAVIPVP